MISEQPEQSAESFGAGKTNVAGHHPSDAVPARLLSLDVLKGIAVLGALTVSIWVFGGFSQNLQNKLLLHPSGGNYRLYAAVSLLFEGKMQALISLVFGAGMLLFMAKWQKLDIGKAHDYLVRRQMWLMAIGILNAIIFLWPKDLLFQLGVVGILLIPFLHLAPKNLWIAASLFSLAFFGKQYWNYSDDRKALRKYEAVVLVEKKIKQDSLNQAKKDSIAKAAKVASGTGLPKDSTKLAKDSAKEKVKADTLTKKQKEEKEAWEGMLKSMKYDAKNDSGKIKSMRNTSYGELWDHLLPIAQSREAEWTYRIGVWELSMMILLGLALFKMDFFHNRFSTGKYLLVAMVCIAMGLLLGWYRLYFHNATLLDYTKFIKNHTLPFNFFIPLERSAMAIGYASLVMALIGHGKPRWLWQALAATGRLSLTNYLVQSIFCTIFFTGFGMNNYSRLEQLELYLVVAEIWLVQIVFSVFWLRFYTQGPAEWLWRCLVEKKWKPIPKQEKIPGTVALA